MSTENDFDFITNDATDPITEVTAAPIAQAQVVAQPTVEVAPAPEPAPAPEVTPAPVAPKKVFNRNDIVRSIPIKIHFPRIYPEYEPFEFAVRLKLSGRAEEERQNYLALSAVEMTERMSNQALNEVCDLLAELPKGFGDLVDTGAGPGHAFRSYVETTTDPQMKEFLDMVVNAVNNAYWNAVSPREFRS